MRSEKNIKKQTGSQVNVVFSFLFMMGNALNNTRGRGNTHNNNNNNNEEEEEEENASNAMRIHDLTNNNTNLDDATPRTSGRTVDESLDRRLEVKTEKRKTKKNRKKNGELFLCLSLFCIMCIIGYVKNTNTLKKTHKKTKKKKTNQKQNKTKKHRKRGGWYGTILDRTKRNQWIAFLHLVILRVPVRTGICSMFMGVRGFVCLFVCFFFFV